MTHFAAIALFACSAAVDEAFRRKRRTREKQSWHPSQVRLWVVLIITYRQTSEMVRRKNDTRDRVPSFGPSVKEIA